MWRQFDSIRYPDDNQSKVTRKEIESKDAHT
jgi:hypothetical protein